MIKDSLKSIFISPLLSLDRFLVVIIAITFFLGLIMVVTASPAIALKLKLDSFYFIKKHVLYLSVAFVLMYSITLMTEQCLKRFAIIGFFLSLILLVLVLVKGHEIKGARRWLSLGMFSIQPSELAKTFFIVFIAWIISIRYKHPDFPVFIISGFFYVLTVLLLILQPDFGMAIMFSVIWVGELFIGGLSILWILVMGIIGIIGISLAYVFLPHVRTRIDLFLDPQNFGNYQIKKAMEAFKKGGLYGVGSGDGAIKKYVPDSHADFIFAVMGEEMGFIACCFLIIMFALLITRGLYLILHSSNKFKIIAISGILIQIGMQAVFNMGMTLNLFPTKGMTLPFISYGGSSILATAIAMGIMLSLTKK
ncbi:MAG: cell division protein FtsW [Rickettsiales bacterium]|nr:cell division protein FtsW [Rickettsiales bacterium]